MTLLVFGRILKISFLKNYCKQKTLKSRCLTSIHICTRQTNLQSFFIQPIRYTYPVLQCLPSIDGFNSCAVFNNGICIFPSLVLSNDQHPSISSLHRNVARSQPSINR